jgi:hypothetical protein
VTNVNMQENSTTSMMTLIIRRPKIFGPESLSMPFFHGGDIVAKTAELAEALPRLSSCVLQDTGRKSFVGLGSDTSRKVSSLPGGLRGHGDGQLWTSTIPT